MAITINGTGIIFPTGFDQQIAVSNFGFGLGGQKWYNFPMSVQSPQRLVNTTYSNDTGRPIMVALMMDEASSTTLPFVVDGVEICRAIHIGAVPYEQSGAFIQCIVPNQSTYRVNNPTGAGMHYLHGWRELR